MRASDHARIAARLAELEARTVTTSGARDRVLAKLAAYHAVLEPVPDLEGREVLLDRLACCDGHLGALREAVLRHV